jgi:phosphatidylinositol-bisphosphatase
MILFFFSIFVGTWNVAGRSPVGSLAVDLDEWLNLKSSADIYVLGYVCTN